MCASWLIGRRRYRREVEDIGCGLVGRWRLGYSASVQNQIDCGIEPMDAGMKND